MILSELFVALALVIAPPAQASADASATAFLDAFRSMDEPRFDRFFSPDVTMFFPESPLGKQRVEGKANVLAAFHHFFASVRKQGSSKLAISPLDQRVQVHGEMAVVTFRLDVGKRLGRRTIIIRKEGAEWRIVHIHASFVDK